MLEEIGQIVTGKAPSSNVIGAFSSSGIPFVTPKDMDGRRWIETTERYLSEAGRQSLKNYLVPKDSVAVSCIGSDMGKAILLKKDSVTNQQINTIIVDASKHNPKYIYYVLSLKQEELKSIAGGSATPILNKGHFSKVVIELPDKVDQDNIVQVLDSLDCKIELNNQINQNLESMAQAIFKSWFIDFDPVRAKIAAKQEGKDTELAAMCAISGKSEAELKQMAEEDFAELQATAALFPDELVESELGELPKGWEVKPLDKIANYLNGLALQKFRPENEYDFLPIVKIAQLKSGVATIEEKASPNIDRKFIIENGDVIFSWSGSLMVDIWCGGKAALNQHLFKVTSNDYHKWLYYFYTKHHLAEFQRIAQAKAVTMGHIKREHLSQALCCIASNQLLEISNIFIGHFLQKLIELRLENNNLKQLRDTLLPKLLSGEVEVENL